jgi:ComF family protein
VLTLLRALALAVRVVLALVGEALSPARCAACDAPARRDAVFCPACAATVERAGVARLGHGRLRRVVALAVYGGAVEQAIRRFKYAGRAELARPLGHLVRRALRGEALDADLVVPVPLHPRRLASRGYNQAALLARAVGAELGAPLAPRALRRVRDTLQQARCRRDERFVNVSGAFVVRAPRAIAGRAVVLVDDVVTTGATLEACACALFDAGAASVVAVVVARAARDADACDATPAATAPRRAPGARASSPCGTRAPPSAPR